MPNVATRLLSLILLLQSRPSWKVAELAAELNVSERTVHRYMGMLDELGIPLYSERGPYGGFALVRGYKLPPLIFTPEEATVLYMGAQLVRDIWGQTYEDAVTGVIAKLDNVLPDGSRQEAGRARQSLVVEALTAKDYRPWGAIIHTLRQCIEDRRCARLVYQGLSRHEATERIVEPYAMMLKWGQWYLVGYCRLRQDLRTFRVDRLQKVAPLAERFTVPADFDVREYLQTMDAEPEYTCVVRLDASLVQQVQERHGQWMKLAQEPDGSITARFQVSTLDWAAGWVLGCGGLAQALEPPELIERVRVAAEGALQRHQA